MQKMKKALTFGFIFGYLFFFYLTLWIAMEIFQGTISNSWEILGEYENKMKMLLVIYPVIAVIFGIGFASISVLSYSAMGSDILTPAKFFGIGWFCIVMANIAILSAALSFFINKDIGQEWLEAIGILKFNTIFFLLAPSIGYTGGIICSIILDSIIKAQRE